MGLKLNKNGASLIAISTTDSFKKNHRVLRVNDFLNLAEKTAKSKSLDPLAEKAIANNFLSFRADFLSQSLFSTRTKGGLLRDLWGSASTQSEGLRAVLFPLDRAGHSG
jgi:hypothetical protein